MHGRDGRHDDDDPQGQLEGEIRSGVYNEEGGRMCCAVTLTQVLVHKNILRVFVTVLTDTYTHIRDAPIPIQST